MTNPCTIFVCTNLRISGVSCAGKDSPKVLKALANACAGIDGVEVKKSVCMGYCGQGPNVKVLGGKFYHEVGEGDVETIVQDALALAQDD